MEEVIKKELLYDLDQAIIILEKKEEKYFEELKQLSDHGIEDVALHKNLDLISLTVLIYSIYKSIKGLPEEDYQDILKGLKNAKKNLESGDLGRYNQNIKILFKNMKRCNDEKKCDTDIRGNLKDVLHASRIKKGAILLEKGLSLGQAAGLMGLSNWDLQEYASKRTFFEKELGHVSQKKRLLAAFKIFRIKSKVY